MTKRKVIKILNEISIFKKDFDLKIVDSHVHPLDVMGIVHYSEVNHACPDGDYLKSGILEFFNYNKIEKIGSKLYFKFFPKGVKNIIHQTYDKVTPDRLITEMVVSLVDKSVLLPLDPWVPTSDMCQIYKDNKSFSLLGSIDINTIKIEDIDQTIKSYIDLYNIVGIKLHPNLQNFKPQPKDNEPEIGEKLSKLYQTVEKYSLYILFHGGMSNYTSEIHKKYGEIKRSRYNALLKNFCDRDGKSELFEKYNIPIVIAHIGHYGLLRIDYNLIKIIVSKYENIFFDTSGVSSKTIRKTLDVIPSRRLIFGSDALYNRVAYNLSFLYKAIMDGKFVESKSTMLKNILSDNFNERLIKRN